MDRSGIFVKLVAAATLSVAGAIGLPAPAAWAAEAPHPVAGDMFPVRSVIGQAPAQESVPVYVPPRRGAPKDVAAAATRGALAPRLKLLAPDHAGLTVVAQPTLYIYTQGAGSLQVQVKRAYRPGRRLHLAPDRDQGSARHPRHRPGRAGRDPGPRRPVPRDGDVV
jgi:hypothetical protein